MSGNRRGALIVFARAPRAGRVKSRLAREIGAGAAAAVYAELLDHALAIGARAHYDGRYVYCADPDEADYFRGRLPSAWQVATQGHGDLGRRMFEAFDDVLRVADYAVLTGSDIADSTTADLDEAAGVFERGAADAVLGPSADGGYWLLGLDRARREVFSEIPWGTAEVAALTGSALSACGLRVHRLAVRHDVDVGDDLARWRERGTPH